MAIRPGISIEGQRRARDEALQRAMFALQNQRPIEAERIASEILKADHGHPEATKLFGYALLMQGRAKEAVASLEQAAHRSRDPAVETQLAIALRRAGREQDALLALNRAIKRRPPYPAAFHELGFLLFTLKRHDEAIAALQRGLEIAPYVPELSTQLGYVFYGRNDRANARAAFARALSIAPRHGDALFGLGRVLNEDGDFAQAARLFQNYLTLKPDDADARIKLGVCLLELGQSEAAYGCFRAATRKGPKYYGKALAALARSGHGRFWLKPSAAARFFRGEKP